MKQATFNSVFILVKINSYSSRIKVNKWKQAILNSVSSQVTINSFLTEIKVNKITVFLCGEDRRKCHKTKGA